MAVSESLPTPRGEPRSGVDRAPATPVAATRITRPAPTPWTAARRRFINSRPGLVGAIVLLAVTLAAVFAGQVSPYDPKRQDFRVEHEAPNLAHWMGTDEFGRDVLSRIIWGAQTSLQAGATAATIALLAGLVLGMLAAYYGGRADNLIMRVMDVLLAFPYILLAIAVVAILGPGLRNAMIAIGIVYVPHYARVVRGAVLSVRARDYPVVQGTVIVVALFVVAINLIVDIVERGQCDHRHRRLELPGPGYPAAHPGLGQHALGGPELRDRLAVDCHVSRSGDPGHGASLQPDG